MRRRTSTRDASEFGKPRVSRFERSRAPDATRLQREGQRRANDDAANSNSNSNSNRDDAERRMATARTATARTATVTTRRRARARSGRRAGARARRARARGEDEAAARDAGETATLAALALAPKEVVDAISVPAELVEVRAYVRWEEAGMPSDTTDAWRQREYDEALLDLKIELLRGTTMNEIRARYKMAPVEGGDAKMFNEDADLARRVKAAAVMKVRASVDEVQGAHEETETIEFIESVVVEDAVVEDGEPEAAAADDDAEEAETVASEVEDAIAAAMENAVAEDTDAIVDVFAALTEEEIADMEASFSAQATWSTREELVAAITATPSAEDDNEVDLLKDLEETKLALSASEEALQKTKTELEDIEAEIVVLQATSDKALAEMKEGWAAEVSHLEAQLKQAVARVGMDEGEIAAQIAKFERDAEEATRRVEALEAEKAVVAKQLEDTKVAQIKAEAVRDANSEVILMLKKELESTKDELREMKSNSVSEKEFTAMQSELDRAWEAAAELQTMWDNDRKVIEFLTKSIDDEKVKKEARQGLNIPVAAKGLLSWARTTISKRANDVSVVSQQTLETVSQAYQELEASTGEFSDDVISDDSESDFMRDM